MTSTQHNMPNLQFLFQLNLKHKVGVDVSASTADLRDKTTGYGRQVMPVTGGQCIGPNINAKILEHGAADWLINGPNGTKLNIRLTLKTEDNEFIYVTYDGFAHLLLLAKIPMVCLLHFQDLKQMLKNISILSIPHVLQLVKEVMVFDMMYML